MDKIYHIQILRTALETRLPEESLAQIIAANLGQDALVHQLGSKAHFHFDNNQLTAGSAYIAERLAFIAACPPTSQGRMEQLAAFGQLSHAAQDFYAHTNYVDLWLEKHGGLTNTTPEQIEPLEAEILAHPALHSGFFHFFPHLLYYIPGIRGWFRRLFLPQDSHEYMNLDSPEKGPRFWYAYHAAVKRTLHEFQSVNSSFGQAAAVS